MDLFHVVHLAVKMTGDVRRRVVRGKNGRRGRSGDREYGIKNLLVRNLEHGSPAQFAKVISALDGGRSRAGDPRCLDRGKEKLRHVLNLRARITGSMPGERDIRGPWLLALDDLVRLETPTSPNCSAWPGRYPRWDDEIVCAVLTGSDAGCRRSCGHTS